jgi:hypothetical protein
MFSLGTIFYVGLLLINALAVLSEDRFLARSSYEPLTLHRNSLTVYAKSVGLQPNLKISTLLSINNMNNLDSELHKGILG